MRSINIAFLAVLSTILSDAKQQLHSKNNLIKRKPEDIIKTYDDNEYECLSIINNGEYALDFITLSGDKNTGYLAGVEGSVLDSAQELIEKGYAINDLFCLATNNSTLSFLMQASVHFGDGQKNMDTEIDDIEGGDYCLCPVDEKETDPISEYCKSSMTLFKNVTDNFTRAFCGMDETQKHLRNIQP